MSKYTSGPWHWEKARTQRHLQNADGSCFALISQPIGARYSGDPRYEADAKLIAAAPDMAEALQKIANPPDGMTAEQLMDRARSIAHSAIQKAGLL